MVGLRISHKLKASILRLLLQIVRNGWRCSCDVPYEKVEVIRLGNLRKDIMADAMVFVP